MSEEWRPLSVREGRQTADYAGPFDGVPDWLLGPLWQFITEQYGLWSRGRLNYAAVGQYRAIASALRISLEDPGEPSPRDARGLQASLLEFIRRDRSVLLDVVDYWLATTDFDKWMNPEGPVYLRELAAILNRAGSVYQIVNGDAHYLARRVAPETLETLQNLTAQGRAGEHLSRGWRAAYGRAPDPSTAYREAIKAVEAAAIPVISPANNRATLGTIIADIRNDPAKWGVSLHGPAPDEQMPDVQGMLELLWKGQSDRHGTPDPDAPLDVTQSDAEAALHLALTLVQWFTTGVVSPR